MNLHKICHISLNIGPISVSGVAMKSSPRDLSIESTFNENSPECSGKSSRIFPERERREREEREKREEGINLISFKFKIRFLHLKRRTKETFNIVYLIYSVCEII